MTTLTLPQAMDGTGCAVATGTERRRSARHPYIIEARLQCISNPGHWEEVLAVNLSEHGVAFQLERPLPLGARFTLEVGFGNQRLISEIIVRRCINASGGLFEIGAEFC